MKVKELKLKLQLYDDEAEVMGIAGVMRINTPMTVRNHRYLTEELLDLRIDEDKNCLLLFKDL